MSDRKAYHQAYEKVYSETRKKLYAKNIETRHARAKRYYEKNHEARRAALNAYGRTLRGRFVKMRSRARLRKIAMCMTFEEYCKIIESETCTYCGEKLPEVGHGLDRKNSTLGYSAENCVPSCARCNHVRGEDEISYEEMFEVVKLLKRLREKNAA